MLEVKEEDGGPNGYVGPMHWIASSSPEKRCPQVLRGNARLGSQWVLSGLSKNEHSSKS